MCRAPVQLRFQSAIQDEGRCRHSAGGPSWITEVQFSFCSSLPIDRHAIGCASGAALVPGFESLPVSV